MHPYRFLGTAALALACLLTAPPASGQITYELVPISTPLGYTADGWLQTDGTLGELTASNFVAFEIAIENDSGTMLTLTESNSTVETIGILATASDLSFDGSNPNFFGSEELDINGPTGFELDLEYGNGAANLYSEFLRVDGVSDRAETPLAELPNPFVFATAVPEPHAALALLVGALALGAGRLARSRP